MGTFSWLKADNLTQVANIVQYKPFKFLIPKEFGGGFIKDYYQGYGYLGTKAGTLDKPMYDIYELLAFWNADQIIPFPNGETVRSRLKWDGEFPVMKEQDQYTSKNRAVGIDIACGDGQIKRLKYPPKLVSASFRGTYESCEGLSFSDPNQGFTPLYREELRHTAKPIVREVANNG